MILVAIGALVALITVFQIYSMNRFQAVSVSPEKTFPSATESITIEFNKDLTPLEDQPQDFAVVEPNLPFVAVINDNVLKIQFGEGNQEDPFIGKIYDGTEFTLNINSIMSAGGKTTSLVLPYKATIKPVEEVAEEDKPVGDILDRHPLLPKLPYDAIAFKVDYYVISQDFGLAKSWQEEKINFRVVVTTYVPRDYGEPISTFKESTERLRNRALEWIKEQGVDPNNDVVVLYEPNDELVDQGLEEFTGDGIDPALLN